jgi:hypothetical protein
MDLRVVKDPCDNEEQQWNQEAFEALEHVESLSESFGTTKYATRLFLNLRDMKLPS